MPSSNNYDSVAGIYDGFSRMVFGNTIKKAQVNQLTYFRPNTTILIAGGGTGWILEEISKIYPSGLNITYVDNSQAMIEQAQKRFIGSNVMTFINEPVENTVILPEHYDIILTPFLFDNFSQELSEKVFDLLDTGLKENGIWLYTDFQLTAKESYWQKILLKSMYVFFKMVSKVEAKKLPAIVKLFSNYALIDKYTYYKDFIVALAFQKSQTLNT